MPMQEDLSTFFDPAEMAHRAVLDNVEVTGIFDNGSRNALDALGGIAVRDPSFTLPSAQCSRVRVDSHLRVVGEGSYSVAAIEPDGAGVTVLHLRRLQA